MNTLQWFHGHSRTCAEWRKIWVTDTHIPSWSGSLTMPSCFHSHAVNKCPVCDLFSVTFCTFLCFSLVISLFKMVSSILLKGCLVLLSSRKLWGVLQRKHACEMSFVQVWVITLLSIILMWKNQQYILNKVSLNRNTHKTRLCTDQLMKMWLDSCRKLTLYFFPRSVMFRIC